MDLNCLLYQLRIQYLQIFKPDTYQVYFTPNGPNNLIVTYAQAGSTNKNGTVSLDKIYLNHFDGIVNPLDQINEAFKILVDMSFNLIRFIY